MKLPQDSLFSAAKKNAPTGFPGGAILQKCVSIRFTV
jgi:hypothetical protein